MTSRPTPFGLFAGISVGRLGRTTSLELSPRASYQRTTRIDGRVLALLCERIVRKIDSGRVSYRANGTLYRLGGKCRYFERVEGDDGRFALARVTEDAALARVLELAASGRPLKVIAEAIASDGHGAGEAEVRAYLDELIAQCVLVPLFRPPVTGENPHPDFGQVPYRDGGGQAVLEVLQLLREADQKAIDAASPLYSRAERTLREIAPDAPRDLLRVNLAKPTRSASLGPRVIEELARGVELLHRLKPTEDRLAAFRRGFRERYGERAVPLLEALDEDLGVSFGGTRARDTQSPLLADLSLREASEPGAAANTLRDEFLLELLGRGNGAAEVVLEDADVERLAGSCRLPLPASFACMATLIGRSPEQVDAGEFRVFLAGITGPGGAELVGRFCHDDPKLTAMVRRLLREEECSDPDALFAEVVHSPTDRLLNVVARPHLREYEIPIVGESLIEATRQIPLPDLLVRVRGAAVELWSRRLQRRVHPRLANAQNFTRYGLRVYRFLCEVAHSGVATDIGFDWGRASGAPFHPRVVHQRVVLSLARWRVPKQEGWFARGADESRTLERVEDLRKRWKLPRFVRVLRGDQGLLVDLEDSVSVQAVLGKAARGAGELVLEEFYPGPDELVVSGPEGKFVHEMVVPFHRAEVEKADASSRKPALDGTAGGPQSADVLIPGGEWLFAKVYTGESEADSLLVDVLAPLIEEGKKRGLFDSWFFVRYTDPDVHLRLRFRGDRNVLWGVFLERLREQLLPCVEQGRIHRLSLDTYQREAERYGGAVGVTACEEWFCLDSVAVAGILSAYPKYKGLDARWRLALRGVHLVFEELGIGYRERIEALGRLRDGLREEFRVDTTFLKSVGRRYRRELAGEAGLSTLIAAGCEEQHPLAAGFAALERRRADATKVWAGAELAKLTRPVNEVAQSLAHMHCNRMFRSVARAQELVVYDFLCRLYRTERATRRSGKE